MTETTEANADNNLDRYLIEKTKDKACISLAELKRNFPKDREKINKLKFVGLLEPVSLEFPDTVRVHIYS